MYVRAAEREPWPNMGTSGSDRDDGPTSSKAHSDDSTESVVDRDGGRKTMNVYGTL